MTDNSQIAKKIMRIGSIEEIEPNLMKTPMIGDLCTEMYHKVDRGKPITTLANGVRIIMYIEDFAVRPPLGEVLRLHQAHEENDVCIYCGKPVEEWGEMEKCPARYEKDNTKKEELVKRFSDWLDVHNLDYIGTNIFDVEFHVFQIIKK